MKHKKFLMCMALSTNFILLGCGQDYVNPPLDGPPPTERKTGGSNDPEKENLLKQFEQKLEELKKEFEELNKPLEQKQLLLEGRIQVQEEELKKNEKSYQSATNALSTVFKNEQAILSQSIIQAAQKTETIQQLLVSQVTSQNQKNDELSATQKILQNQLTETQNKLQNGLKIWEQEKALFLKNIEAEISESNGQIDLLKKALEALKEQQNLNLKTEVANLTKRLEGMNKNSAAIEEKFKLLESNQKSTDEKLKATTDQLLTALKESEDQAKLVAQSQSRIAWIETQLSKMEPKLEEVKLKTSVLKFTKIDERPSLIISGVNLYLQNGANATYNSNNGLGNFIIGYNENLATDSEAFQKRTGSHNIIVGRLIDYNGTANIGIGANHILDGHSGGVLGGTNNSTSAPGAVVISGRKNTVASNLSVAVGGENNNLKGYGACTFAGMDHQAEGKYATIVGGKGHKVLNNEFGLSIGGFNAKVEANFGMTINGHTSTVAQPAAFGLKLGGFNQTVNQVHQVLMGNQETTTKSER